MKLLDLTRPLVCLDVEATGPNAETDRIIELGLVRLTPYGERTSQRWLVNPGRSIPVEATNIHGITDLHVEGAPTFAEIAIEVSDALTDVDLCGFNLRVFDVPILKREFQIADQLWPCVNARTVDVFDLYRAREKRTLTDAVRFYLGRAHAGAHGAVADAEATLDVLRAQLGRYTDLPSDLAALDVVTGGRQPDWATECGRLRRNADGELVIHFGRHHGERLSAMDPGFLKWVLNRDFPEDVKSYFRFELYGPPQGDNDLEGEDLL